MYIRKYINDMNRRKEERYIIEKKYIHTYFKVI